MQIPNTRIMLIVALVLAILLYISLLLSGGGLHKDHFADMGSKSNTFTLYYMNGCPHCESILPDYKSFVSSGSYSSGGKSTKIRMVEQGDSSAAAEIDSLKIAGFPTFYLATADGRKVEYKGDRTVPAMKTFISQNAV